MSGGEFFPDGLPRGTGATPSRPWHDPDPSRQQADAGLRRLFGNLRGVPAGSSLAAGVRPSIASQPQPQPQPWQAGGVPPSYGGGGAARFLPGGSAGWGDGEGYGLMPWNYQVPNVTYEPRFLESEPVAQVVKQQKKKKKKTSGRQGSGGSDRNVGGSGSPSGPGSQGGSDPRGGSGAGPHG